MPIAPLQGYRFPMRGSAWYRALDDWAPSMIEAADPYRLGWLASDYAARRQIPAVAFFHSDLIGMLERRLGALSRPMITAYLQRLYRRFDLLLAPSNSMASKLMDLGFTNVAVQPLGVDIQTFSPARAEPQALRRRYGIQDNKRLLVFAGRNAREKNIPALVDAARRLGPGYHLIIAGLGMPHTGLSNVTTIDTHLTTEQTAWLLASADALLHGGDCETFALIALEAQACGTPVVGVRAGAMTERVEDAGFGTLAKEAEGTALASAVQALFTQWPQALHGGPERAALRGWVVSRFNWDTVLRGLLGHYARLGLEVEPGVAPRAKWDASSANTGLALI